MDSSKIVEKVGFLTAKFFSLKIRVFFWGRGGPFSKRSVASAPFEKTSLPESGFVM